MNQKSGLAVMLVALFCLTACVVETTGPVFNVEVSDEEALVNYLQLARGYMEEGDFATAKNHLENAAEIDPNNSEMFGIWGLIYAREGEFDLADSNFRRALRIDSDNSRARNNYAAFLFSQNRIEDAYDQLELVVRDTEYPQRPQAFENMGLAALRLDRTDDAVTAFTRALQLNPNQVRSALELAAINVDRENIQQAAAYWGNYLTLMQFYNIGHNARSLLIGAKLEHARENEVNSRQYGELLRTNFPNSPEYATFQQDLE